MREHGFGRLLRGYDAWTLVVFRGFVCPLVTVPACLGLGVSFCARAHGTNTDGRSGMRLC